MMTKVKKEKKKLTPAEEEIMQVLWKIEKGIIKDILKEFPNPKPAYNTISTVLRVMENKGFVAHDEVGVFYQFYPLITKDTYAKSQAKSLLRGYFESSLPKLTAAFAKEENLTLADIEQINQIFAAAKETKKE
jgi:predicted transcriptional regulator